MRRLGTLLVAAAVMAGSGAVAFAQAQAARPAGAVRTITITAVETPKIAWDVTKIDAKPGEEIRVVVKTVGKMPKVAMAHNFVLLKSGLAEKDVTTFANEAAMSAKTAYVPAARQAWVLANTPTAAGAGETTEVTFKAPTAPGDYPYLCSFPGHYVMGMKGILTVK